MEHKRTFINSNAQTSFLSVIRLGMERFCMGFQQTPTYHLTLALPHPICSCRGKFGQDKLVWRSPKRTHNSLYISLNVMSVSVVVFHNMASSWMRTGHTWRSHSTLSWSSAKNRGQSSWKRQTFGTVQALTQSWAKKWVFEPHFGIYIPKCPKYNYVYKMSFDHMCSSWIWSDVGILHF